MTTNSVNNAPANNAAAARNAAANKPAANNAASNTAPVDNKAAETKPAENKPAENAPANNAPANNAPANNAPANNAPANNAPAANVTTTDAKKGDLDLGDHFKDFFVGFGKEGMETAAGLYTLVTTNPITTAKGLFYMVTHPKSAAQAIIEPYTTAYKEGRYGELAGRVGFQALTMYLTAGPRPEKKGAQVGTGAVKPPVVAAPVPTEAVNKAAAAVGEDLIKNVATRRAEKELTKWLDEMASQGKKINAGLQKSQMNRLLSKHEAAVRVMYAQNDVVGRLAQNMAKNGIADNVAAGITSVQALQSANVGAKYATLINPTKFLPANAEKIAAEVATLQKLAGSNTTHIAEAAAKQLADFDALTKANPAMKGLVDKAMLGQKLGAAEVRAAATKMKVHHAATTVGEVSDNVAKGVKAGVDFLDAGGKRLTVRDYITTAQGVPGSIARGTKATVDALVDGIRRIPLPEFKMNFKMPNVGEAILNMPMPSAWDLMASPVTVPLGTLKWAATHPGRAIGLAATAGNLGNVGRMGHLMKSEDYKAGVLKAIDEKLATATPDEKKELEALKKKLSGLAAEDVLKMKADLDAKGIVPGGAAPIVNDPVNNGPVNNGPTRPHREYALKEGDTLESIAERELGDPERWREIYDLNRDLFDALGENGTIEAGTIIKLPSAAPPDAPTVETDAEVYKAAVLQLIDKQLATATGDEKAVLTELKTQLTGMSAAEVLKLKPELDAEGLKVDLPASNAPGNNNPGTNTPGTNGPGNNNPTTPPGNNNPTPPVNAPGTKPPAPAQPTEYAVKRGDSLTAIAQAQLGDWKRWRELVDLNKDRYPSLVTNPDLILIGWKLKMPAAPVGNTTGPTPNAPANNAPANNAPADNAQEPSATQRAEITRQFNLETSDGNWRSFWQEVSQYPTNAIGPDAGTDADRKQLQVVLQKLGFRVEASGSYYVNGADGKPKTNADGFPESPTAEAVIAFKKMAGLKQTYNVVGKDGKAAPDVNEYVTPEVKQAMQVALRLLQDRNIRSEAGMQAVVREAARLQATAIGPDTAGPEARKVVQQYLEALGYPVSQTGTFDDATINALLDFKRKHGLSNGLKDDAGRPVFTPYVDGLTADAMRDAVFQMAQKR